MYVSKTSTLTVRVLSESMDGKLEGQVETSSSAINDMSMLKIKYETQSRC